MLPLSPIINPSNRISRNRALVKTVKIDDSSLSKVKLELPALRKRLRNIEVMRDKSRPYWVGKNFQNLNGKIAFKNGQHIACRHLAITAFMLNNQLQSTKALHTKNHLSLFKTIDQYENFFGNSNSLKTHVPLISSELFKSIAYDDNTHATLICTSQWGHFISLQFDTLRCGQAKQFLMLTINHAMLLMLYKKTNQYATELQDDIHYVVKFYDPNITANYRRVATNHKNHIKTWTVSQFIDDQNIRHYQADAMWCTEIPDYLTCPVKQVMLLKGEKPLGSNVLLLAAMLGDNVLLKKVLQCELRDDFDINATTGNGWTALHCAANFGSAAKLNILLSYPGIDVNAKTHDGITALSIVLRRQNLEKLNAILSKLSFNHFF